MLFQRNLINLTPKSALQLAKNNQASNKLQEEQLRAFRIHNGENANGDQCDVPSELVSGVDGSYWVRKQSFRRLVDDERQ